MPKRPEEWFRQADYDLKTAQVLYENGRYIHAVFICHLCMVKEMLGKSEETLQWLKTEL